VALHRGFPAHNLSAECEDVRREGDIDEAKCDENEEAKQPHSVMVEFGDAHGRAGDDLGPAE